jgi:hypothetical protein
MASTEDVAFSRDLTYAGVPLFCAWQSWAGHIKPKMVGKPLEIPPQNVPGWVVDRAQELSPDEDRSQFQAWREKPRGVVIRSPKPGKPEGYIEQWRAAQEACARMQPDPQPEAMGGPSAAMLAHQDACIARQSREVASANGHG